MRTPHKAITPKNHLIAYENIIEGIRHLGIPSILEFFIELFPRRLQYHCHRKLQPDLEL